MRRIHEHDDAGEAPSGRWQRRARREAAARRRIPKHGKAYVILAEQMLARRAQAGQSPDAPREASTRRPRARPPSA